MNISFGIMAHGDRVGEANELCSRLLEMPFTTGFISFDDGSGEWENGKKTLENYVKKDDFFIVLQDDAIIGDNFYINLVNAIENVPEQTIISLYTGKVRPFPKAVTTAVTKAQAENASWLSHQTLLWGVGIAVNTKLIPAILENAKRSNLAYDRRIGSYFKKTRQNVYYTVPSIVDHNADLPSLTGHGYAKEPRVAHIYSDEILNFNNKVIGI